MTGKKKGGGGDAFHIIHEKRVFKFSFNFNVGFFFYQNKNDSCYSYS